MRHSFTREFYIPKGSTRIADKLSGAVAYVWERDGLPYAMLFYGKQAKPVWRYRFASTAKREARIVAGFADYQAHEKRQTERRAERNASTHSLELGHILKASWGYDQTNVDFYQVTRVISTKMVEVRHIGSTINETETSMSGTVIPLIDGFNGDPLRRRASRHGVRIDSSRYASIWSGKPAFESSWH